VKAKDGRDLVFVFAGFQDPGRKVVAPNYESRTAKVYNEVAKRLIEDTGNLGVFGIAGLGGWRGKVDRLEGLASWAPHWRVSLPQGQPFVTSRAGSGFDAVGELRHEKVEGLDVEMEDVLRVRGREIGVVKSIDLQTFEIGNRKKGGLDLFINLGVRIRFLLQFSEGEGVLERQGNLEDIKKRIL
jgi:hypothetical protein